MKRTPALILTVLVIGIALGYLAGSRSATEKSRTSDPSADPILSPVPPVEPEVENAAAKGKVRSGGLRRQIRTKAAVRDFTFDWSINPDGVYANTFMGIPAIQNPNDAWITQEILSEVKPDFVVEAGTLEGGSAAFWATLLEQINPGAKVITIDIFDKVTDAKTLPIVQKSVEFLHGSSTDPEIVAKVKKRVAGKRVLVILDSDHSEDHVYAELQAYWPIVSLGSYLIVQDTGLGIPRYERWPGIISAHAGADRAVRRFMKNNREFQTDMRRERLVMTHNPRGYLRRVR